ncbi:MAG TPA: FixH family protein [Polyangia bacterium]|jgi:hypothetical protein
MVTRPSSSTCPDLRRRSGVLAAALAAAILGGGCGAAGGDQAAAPSFASAPFQTVTSSSGRLQVALRWSPAVPVKGENTVELTFLDQDGGPVTDLSATVVPWMPAHAHGTSVQPVVTTTAPGVVVATPLYLYMAGEWQIRVTTMTATATSGGADDAAVGTVQIQ